MNYRTLLIILLLSSCAPTTMALPTVSPTLSPVTIFQTETPTSTPTSLPTVLIDPSQIPTPINTPHPAPTALNLDLHPAIDRSALYDARVEGFKNTLSFRIIISGIGVKMQKADHYAVYMEGILTNISSKPIVVHSTRFAGETSTYVIWNIFYKGEMIGDYLCCYDPSPDLSTDDFVVLQPNEFQKYLLGLELPFELSDDEGHKISLPHKKIQLTAKYQGFDVGYNDTETIPSRYVDMNAWVGLVESNSVEIVFP